MGTAAFPSSSFLNLNFRFRLLPAAATQQRNPNNNNSKWCCQCKGRRSLEAFSWRTRRSRRFDGMSCFSIDGGNDGGEEKRSGSTEEVEQRRVGVDDSNSKRSPPASVSSRVQPFPLSLSLSLSLASILVS